MKKKLPILIAIVLILLLCAGFAFSVLYEKYSYSDERADLQEYYGLEKEDSVAIVLGDELIEDKGLCRDGVYYLDLNTIHTYFNNRFYLDNSIETKEMLIYTTTDTNYRVNCDSKVVTTESGEEQSDFVIMLYENDTCYVAIDYVVRFTDMTYEVFTEPNRMQIYNVWPEKTIATVKKDTQVRYRGGVKSEILTDVSPLRNKISEIIYDLCGYEMVDNWGNEFWERYFKMSTLSNPSYAKAVLDALPKVINANIFERFVSAYDIFDFDDRIQGNASSIPIESVEAANNLHKDIKQKYPDYLEQFYLTVSNIFNSNYDSSEAGISDVTLPF